MRILILSVSAIALSGCSWLGLGNKTDYRNNNYQQNSGSYGYKTNKTRSSNGCHSGQCLARWNIEAAVGPTFNVGGTAISGDEAHPGVAINNISFSEAYNEGIRGEIGGSYALSPNRKVTGNVFYEHADSEGVLDLGTVGILNQQTLSGSLSDYQSYGAEIGLRQYFAPRRFGGIIGNIRPYVEGKIGATRLDDISLEGATVGGTSALAPDIPFYRSGWVGSAAGLAGIETPIARHATIALESGLRYTQGPRTDTSVLAAGTPLAGINNGDGRLSIPLMLRGRYRF